MALNDKHVRYHVSIRYPQSLVGVRRGGDAPSDVGQQLGQTIAYHVIIFDQQHTRIRLQQEALHFIVPASLRRRRSILETKPYRCQHNKARLRTI